MLSVLFLISRYCRRVWICLWHCYSLFVVCANLWHVWNYSLSCTSSLSIRMFALMLHTTPSMAHFKFLLLRRFSYDLFYNFININIRHISIANSDLGALNSALFRSQQSIFKRVSRLVHFSRKKFTIHNFPQFLWSISHCLRSCCTNEHINKHSFTTPGHLSTWYHANVRFCPQGFKEKVFPFAFPVFTDRLLKKQISLNFAAEHEKYRKSSPHYNRNSSHSLSDNFRE